LTDDPLGAIEGAAERYGEQVQVVERTCMKQGASVCRFDIRFVSTTSTFPEYQQTPEQQARQQRQQHLVWLVWEDLPEQDGITLTELHQRLQQRPRLLLEAVQHLYHAGLVSTSANQPGDDLTRRRYWRAPALGSEQDEP
jgi:hypothetical protein